MVQYEKAKFGETSNISARFESAKRQTFQPSLTRRGGEEVTRLSAKQLCSGSIPLRASRKQSTGQNTCLSAGRAM